MKAIRTRTFLIILISLILSACLTPNGVSRETPSPSPAPTLSESTASTGLPDILTLAIKALKDNDFAQAARIARIYLDDNHTDFIDIARYVLGRSLMGLNKPEAARSVLTTLINEHPQSAYRAHAQTLLADMDAKDREKDTRLGDDAALLEKLRSVDKRLKNTDASSQRQALADAKALLDNEATPEAVFFLAQQDLLSGDLLALTRLKAGLLAYHMDMPERARDFLNALTGQPAPQDVLDRSRALLERLDRIASVDPRFIGVVLPMTGPYQSVGNHLWEAIQLAAGALDSEAPPVTVLLCDNESDPIKSSACVDRLVEEHVAAIIGPVASDTSQAAAYQAQHLGVPIITLSQREDLPDIGDQVFRMALTPKAQARAVARYAMNTLGLKTFAILYPQEPYGMAVMHHFWDEVGALGGSVTAIESYPSETTDFTTLVKSMVGRLYPSMRTDYSRSLQEEDENNDDPYRRRKAKEQVLKNLPPLIDFDAVFIPDSYRPVSMAVPALAYEGLDFHSTKPWEVKKMQRREEREGRRVRAVWLLGISGWNTPKLLERAAKYVEEAVFCDGFFADSDHQATKTFVARYKETFKRIPTVLEAYAFDAAALLTDIQGGDSPAASRQELGQRLRSLKGVTGATGPLQFDARGDLDTDLFMLSFYRGAVVPADQVNKAPQEAGTQTVKPPAGQEGSAP